MSEPWPMVITLSTLLITVVFFIYGKIRSDLVAVAALVILMFTGVLTPAEAFTGFSNPIIFTIASMFIVSGAIVRSGLANTISASILGIAGTNQKLLFFLIMIITALIGALVSNTGTVAIMMPIVGSMALALNVSPSRFLMPLAFMAGIGGMLTLVGNPPNMVANDVYVKAGYESLKLFSFLPIGIICMLFGVFILTPVTSFMLARRSAKKQEKTLEEGNVLDALADKYKLAQNIDSVYVPEDSPAVGKPLSELKLTDFKVTIQEIRRKKKKGLATSFEQVVPEASTVLKGGDQLSLMGTHEAALVAAEYYGFNIKQEGDKKTPYKFDAIGICELVIMSASRLANATIASSGLREQFGITVLGIQRGDKYILENLKDQVINSGDALLVQGTWANINRLDNESRNWVVVGKPMENTAIQKRRIPHVIIILFAMIVIMATGVLPTVLAALMAALALIVAGCFKNMRDAYTFMNWETLIMIACMLPLATAMDKTGIVAIVGNKMSSIGIAYGPLAALGAIYIITSLLNTVISFTPLALLIAPIAMRIALQLDCDPLPFMFAVAASAGLCFGSSFSTPSNALVVSAGRYTFMDYLKIGLPLQLLLGLVLIFTIPLIFPF